MWGSIWGRVARLPPPFAPVQSWPSGETLWHCKFMGWRSTDQQKYEFGLVPVCPVPIIPGCSPPPWLLPGRSLASLAAPWLLLGRPLHRTTTGQLQDNLQDNYRTTYYYCRKGRTAL